MVRDFWNYFALIVLGVVALAFMAYRKLVGLRDPRPQSPRRRKKAGSQPSQADERYHLLLTMLRGNRDQADRLIDYERAKAPEAGQTRLIENAIDRLRQDVGR